MRCVKEREQTILQFVIVKNKLPFSMHLSCYWQWTSSQHCQSSRRIHEATASSVHKGLILVTRHFLFQCKDRVQAIPAWVWTIRVWVCSLSHQSWLNSVNTIGWSKQNIHSSFLDLKSTQTIQQLKIIWTQRTHFDLMGFKIYSYILATSLRVMSGTLCLKTL